MENINIMECLKTQTGKLHILAHELPFFKALFKRELKIDSYVGQLRALAVIHEVLEREMASSDHPAVKSVLNGCMPKLPLLTRDICYFDHLNIRETAAANSVAMSLSDKIILRKQQNPVSLIGYLYTLEGSTLGGKVIKPYMADLFGLKGADGLLFFDSYGENVRSNWAGFSQRMLDAVQDELTAKNIIEASHELFYGLFKIYESLHPLNKGDTP